MYLRIVVALFLVVIIAALAFWRPWEDARTDRTIGVDARATITAVPDEFVFSPSYQFKSVYQFEGLDQRTALDEADKRNGELIAELKKLGISEQKIKTSTSSYDRPLPGGAYDETTCTLTLTIKVHGQELGQKVQDYLATTSPASPVSPQLYFSEQKQKELGSQARDIATKDARAKAEQSAQNLGLRVGVVQKVNDGFAFGISAAPDAAYGIDTQKKLVLHPGENEITYTMMVTFYLE